MAYTYEYPHPAVTVDCVVFALDDMNLKLLLIKRDLSPYKGKWALPGGFVHEDETLDEAAFRELKEETGVARLYLEQLYTFGDPKRDPRERVITVAYYSLVNLDAHILHASTDAMDAAWFNTDDLPSLAFDHEIIIDAALLRLKNKLRYEPIAFELLPQKFTLSQVQRLYETVLNTALDKRNFRKKIAEMEFVEPLDEVEIDVSHRAAQLYRFNSEKYRESIKKGFSFEI